MTDCIEVLFVTDNSGRLQTANCYDPHIGTTLMTYRGGGGASKNCLSVIGNDYLISADAGKPIIHIWPLNSQEPTHDLRTIAPGKPSALCISPDGCYCVAGIDGKIYVWLISSGCLLNVISRHYQAISKIIFTDDSSYFITSGEDGLVFVWKLADVVAKQFGDIFKLTTTQITPVYSFTQHSLPVTDIFVGRGSLKARLFTVSTDQSCKVFSLTNGTLLLTLVYDHVLTSVTANELETQLFVGYSNGQIKVLDLDPYPRSLEHHISDVDPVGTFLGHEKAVTCLSTSFDGTTLASGSGDEKVYIWDIPSRQMLRSFDMKGPISNLFFHCVPENIFANKFEPSLAVKRFEKVSNLEEKNLEVNVWVHGNRVPISFRSEPENKIEVYGGPLEGSEKTAETEDIESLKRQISSLKEINKQLYQFAMNKILKNPLSIAINGENDRDFGDD